MTYVITWCKQHWLYLALFPGNLLMIETVVKSSAEAHGYKKTANTCDKIGNFLSFIADIVSGLLAKKQTTITEVKL